MRVEVLRHGPHSTGLFRLAGTSALWGSSPGCGACRGRKPSTGAAFSAVGSAPSSPGMGRSTPNRHGPGAALPERITLKVHCESLVKAGNLCQDEPVHGRMADRGTCQCGHASAPFTTDRPARTCR
ncbi:hypothetical protein HMPREF1129_2912 [Actinomyces naeslundii str. Howell 279]|uniref:Uncharacterized protein n=1 Tax=Actinomyces naeslundii (strain ATCC 12104 / DSM 43013 / CCUG 2238 / JCM 8349 / NCTC 10301 / Howell 279) TaxID=1115803 RepID=J3F3V8_ACTNH|nr:hypothetical protein HMPREF1129_2912 [Actinomyces naeslundii str. Howell 279]